jgi:hypothetical protein
MGESCEKVMNGWGKCGEVVRIIEEYLTSFYATSQIPVSLYLAICEDLCLASSQ